MCEELMKKEEKKMATNSHSRASERSHSRRKMKKEDAKANGKRMSQEEIEKEVADLKEQLNALRRMLEENQRLGWVLRKKPVEWHEMQRRLQQKQVKWLKEKLKEVELEMEESICEPEQGEFLGESEDEDLKTGTSSETKRSDDFKSDNLCMFAGETCKEGQFSDIVIKEKEDQQNLNSVLEEDEIDRSHIQLGKDIKKVNEGLHKIEEETIEEFLSHKENWEQQGDMMVETSSGTTGSYVFKIDSLFVDVEQRK